MEQELCIITIAYEETKELWDTYHSIQYLLQKGTKWVVVINQPLKKFIPPKNTTIIEGQDDDLYDALNIGLNEVDTDYFMLLHSGDEILDPQAMLQSFSLMDGGYDCVIGGALIGNRTHNSRFWQRWMFMFYVQPPHLPIIYRSEVCLKLRYETSILTVADFYYLKELFLKRNVTFKHSNKVYVNMKTGGLTTSGLKSFIHVTAAFIKVDGLRALFLSPFRFLLKLFLR